MTSPLVTDDMSTLFRLRMRVADLRGRGIYAGYPDRNRCIFIHIPKTAGSSVLYSLFGEPSRHVPYFVYQRANPRKFERYFKFAFVRNPWDRLVSSYFYLRNGGSGGEDKEWADRNLVRYPDFRSFVHGWVNEENVMTWRHFVPQSYYILDCAGTVKVDFVGRYERLAEDFRYVSGRLGRNVAIAAMNASTHAPFSSYYDAEMSAVVQRVYARDIEAFGYSAP